MKNEYVSILPELIGVAAYSFLSWKGNTDGVKRYYKQ